MKSDQELRQGFKVFLDENDIVNVVFLKEELDPEASVRYAEFIEQDVLEIFNKDTEKEYNGIVDFSPMVDNIGYVASDIRKIYSRIMFHKQVKNIAMIMVVSNIFYKAVVNLMIYATTKGKNLKWFSNKKEALKWLKKQK